MTIAGSQKHKSRSCQAFLRFRPGTGIASLLCIILTHMSYRPRPELVWEGTIQEYEFGEEMCMGGTFGEPATTVCCIARVDHQVPWTGDYTFHIKSMEVRNRRGWESAQEWQGQVVGSYSGQNAKGLSIKLRDIFPLLFPWPAAIYA